MIKNLMFKKFNQIWDLITYYMCQKNYMEVSKESVV